MSKESIEEKIDKFGKLYCDLGYHKKPNKTDKIYLTAIEYFYDIRQATIRECIESAPKKLNLDEEKERFRTDDILELQEYIGGHNSAISDYQQALKDKLK